MFGLGAFRPVGAAVGSVAIAASLLTGCESEAPSGTGDTFSREPAPASAACGAGAAVRVPSRQPSATDYTPRTPTSAGSRFPACISDDGTYHPINADVPSNARIAAVVEIGKLLHFDGKALPSPQDFADARALYTQPEGVDSRVQRREDIHFPPATLNGVPTACKDLTDAERAGFPERCAGPVKLIPLLNDAFMQGEAGADPRVAAARVEAALLWFLWLSFYKEADGCFSDPGQCDSTSAYWGGQQDVSATPLGYGATVRPLSEESFQRGWDAVLAVRCAKDLADSKSADAARAKTDALAQVDRVNNHALALILRQRLTTLPCEAAYAFIQVLGPQLDAPLRARDATAADQLKALLQAPLATFDAKQVETLLADHFGCP